MVTPSKEATAPTNPTPAKVVRSASQSVRKSVVAGIEGFSDWNLVMLKDFISCMDKTRKKYAVMKVKLNFFSTDITMSNLLKGL